MKSLSLVVCLLSLASILGACATLASPDSAPGSTPFTHNSPTEQALETSADHRSQVQETRSDGPACEEIIRFHAQDEPFRQVVWMIADAESSFVQYRVPTGSGDDWSPWHVAAVTFEEGRAYNARILLETPANFLELRGGPSLAGAHLSFQERVTARRSPLKHTYEQAGEHRPAHQNSPPQISAGTLISPRDWGALPTATSCGHKTRPYRVSFHHTAAPHDDGDDAASRVRQIQSFHVNERGWCDIGYHFLISQAGEIFQGRSQIDRTGAHVARQNKGNIGIAFIGDFTLAPPTSAQLDAAIDLTRHLHQTYRIPLNRNAFRGHHEWPGQKTQCPGDKMNIGDLDTISFIVERAALPREPAPTLVSDNR